MHKILLVALTSLYFIGCGSSKATYTDTKNIQSLNQDYNTKVEKNGNSITTKSQKTLKNFKKPILDYRFDICKISDTIYDDSRQFDAKAKNHPKVVKSILNNGLHFDGKESYLKLPTMDIDYNDGFSFSAWIRFEDKAGNGKNWETIFSLGNDDSDKRYSDKHQTEIWLNRYYNTNKLYFAFSNGDRDELCGDIKTTNNVLKPNTLQHIAVTIDHDNYPHIFIDGSEVQTEVAWHNRGGACEIPSVSRDLCYIGKPNDEWIGFDKNGKLKDHKDNNLFKGDMDEIKLFNTALNKDEIKNIYLSQKTGLNYDTTTRVALNCQTKAPIKSPIADPSPNTSSDPLPNHHNSIIIDADSSDWGFIKGETIDGSTIKSFEDSTYLYFLFESKSIQNPTAIWFINSDNNPKTGYQANEWKDSGADFAVGTSGKLYIAKTNDSKWEWDDHTLGNAVKFISKNGVIELMVKKSSFKITDSYQVGVRVFDGSPDSLKFPIEKMLNIKSSKDEFQKIRETLSKYGSTYISVGDSTRADDNHFKNGEVFKTIKKALGTKTTSYLEAYSGEKAKDLVQNGVVDIINEIPQDGAYSVVNISLGINDARAGYNKNSILTDLKTIINKILQSKPKTNILLTMPNKMVGQDSSPYINAYRELSKDFAMIDTEELFKTVDLSLYRSQDAIEYGTNIRIHLSPKGQKLVSDRILSFIK